MSKEAKNKSAKSETLEELLDHAGMDTFALNTGVIRDDVLKLFKCHAR